MAAQGAGCDGAGRVAAAQAIKAGACPGRGAAWRLCSLLRHACVRGSHKRHGAAVFLRFRNGCLARPSFRGMLIPLSPCRCFKLLRLATHQQLPCLPPLCRR